MGHSLDGYFSLSFHVEHAEGIRALVLVGTGPGYRNPEARAGWNQYAEARAQFFERRGLEELDRIEAHGNRHRSAEGLIRAARGILVQHDGLVMDDLRNIRVPTLIVVGADDTPFLGASEYMEKRILGSRRVILPDAGHMPNLDQPRLLQRELGSFLAGACGEPTER